jgi:hypothetical protein
VTIAVCFFNFVFISFFYFEPGLNSLSPNLKRTVRHRMREGACSTRNGSPVRATHMPNPAPVFR